MKTEMERNNELQRLVDKMYEEMPMKIFPVFPYILIRTIPRHRMAGRFYLPDDNNKTLSEGFVLEVFRPFWRYVKTEHDEGFNSSTSIMVECVVKPGDYVLFQRFEGVPVEHALTQGPYLKSRDYLLVAANPFQKEGRNGIVAKIERTSDVRKILEDELYARDKQDLPYTRKMAINSLLEKLIMCPVDEMSVTQSGLSRDSVKEP